MRATHDIYVLGGMYACYLTSQDQTDVKIGFCDSVDGEDYDYYIPCHNNKCSSQIKETVTPIGGG